MQQKAYKLIAAMALLASVWAVPSFAADASPNNKATATHIKRSALEFKGAAAKAVAGITADRSASRDLKLDDKAVEKAFTLVGRSRDGKETRIAPGDKVLKAIQDQKADDKRTDAGTNGTAADTQSAAEGTERGVIGSDNRVAVKNTAQFPYSTVGYLQMTNSKGEIWSCTASVIGPNTIITAGHCLYNHDEEGGWRDKFTFWPGLNGKDTAPFGGYEYDMAYVFEGFITEYKNSYDDVWPYDVGLLTFKDRIGDQTGWLGYTDMADAASDFQGTLVGYHSDKPEFTQWRSSCDVVTENISETDFTHDCDFAAGANGAPIYVYDKSTKSRNVVGINVGELGQTNWALRLYKPIYEWIAAIDKR